MVCHICQESLLNGDLSSYSCGCVVHTMCIERFHGERCPQCNTRIQIHHRVYLNLAELLENIAQLRRLLQIVEENARRRRDLFDNMMRDLARRQ